MIVLQIAIACILAFLILRQPYLGVVITIASLPVVTLLPPIPGFTSIVSLFGGVTLAGFVWQRKKERRSLFHFGIVHILGLLFIGWIFLSNPQAAWFGLTRNWVSTFLQLWMLLWLTGELLDTPEKHKVLMWVYSLVTVASALIAIQQGHIGAKIGLSTRASGFAEEANTAARYFIVGLLFLNYLRTVVNKSLPRLLVIAGIIVLILGVFFTVSRTGILLLFTSLALLIFLNSSSKYRFQLIIIFAIALFAIWSMSDNIINIMKAIVPSITQGVDTIGLRYSLWNAGWRMWLAYPFQGVGIGMYPLRLRNFDPGFLLGNKVAHNMYIGALAETGLVGFTLFMFLLVRSLQNIWRIGNTGDVNIVSLRNVWLIVFLIMLLGGITQNEQTDKMIWVVMGVGVYFSNQVQARIQKNAVHKTTRNIQVCSLGRVIVEK